MELNLIIQDKDGPPQLAHIKQPLIDLTSNEAMTIALIEGGMASGEPAVIIVTQDDDGSVAIQTSFDKFLTAASGMMAAAESRWGWKRPEGYISIDPVMPKEARKALLESVKKELEEWDDTEETNDD
jgi:hypothetical protein